MTVGYYVLRGNTVIVTSVVMDTLSSYGFDKLLDNIREYVPVVLAIPKPIAPWLPSLGVHLQLKTGESHLFIICVVECLVSFIVLRTNNPTVTNITRQLFNLELTCNSFYVLFL